MKDKAKATLAQYWKEGAVPVDPFRIAANMGIPVLADPELEASGHYEPAGFKGRPLITYNPRETN